MGSLELETQGTIMAIRERLMVYFKGSCVQRVTHINTLNMVSLNNVGRDNYYYLRREADNEAAQMLVLCDVPLLTVKRTPERLIFHAQTLNRSPQLRQVRAELESFMGKYLQGVILETNEGAITYA